MSLPIFNFTKIESTNNFARSLITEHKIFKGIIIADEQTKGHRSTDKRYSGDNRLIPPKSLYRRRCLAPRCRLISSWGCSRSQGYGCLPFKEVRELGLKRRETVWSLSSVGAAYRDWETDRKSTRLNSSHRL